MRVPGSFLAGRQDMGASLRSRRQAFLLVVMTDEIITLVHRSAFLSDGLLHLVAYGPEARLC